MAGVSTTRTSFQTYRAGQVPIADMVYTLKPQIDSVAEVSTVQFGNASSGAYRIADYYDLTLAIDKALETADAVVVTTGTGTMDEFVYLGRSDGAQREAGRVHGRHAPLDRDRLGRAGQPLQRDRAGREPRDHLLRQRPHAQRRVPRGQRRLEVGRAAAGHFRLAAGGGAGHCGRPAVRTFRAPPRIQRCATPGDVAHTVDLRTISRDQLPRVEVLIGYQGAGLDEAVAAWADAGVKGIVVSGGGLSAAARRAAEEKGVTFATTYRFRTGGDNLYPEKARLLLLLFARLHQRPRTGRPLAHRAGRR